MAKTGCFTSKLLESPLPIRNIGIIYCTSTKIPTGREHEKLADCEIIDVANAIHEVLVMKGYQAEMIDLDPMQIGDLRRFDWVFNLTESIYGFPVTEYEIAEDMEKYQIPFTGSGSKTLKTCLDKAVTKRELLKNGIITPDFEVFQPGDTIRNVLEYPVIVKPIREDGSIGITRDSIVRSDAALGHQVQKIHTMYHQAALVENYIEGKDVSASVIGNHEAAFVLPLSETVYSQLSGPRFLTFDAKWSYESPESKAATSRCPSILAYKTEAAIKEIALRAYRLMDCQDYGRVDFRLRNGIPFVLEVNPNPCINPDDSGFVRSGKAAGYSYADLVMMILENAVHDRLQAVEAGYLELVS